MKAKQIARALESLAPPSLAESYDNVGLLVGDPEMEVRGALVTLDVTEDVLDEALAMDANMIIAHHPIWFTPRKRLNGEDYVSRIIMRAIKRDIAIYACHTNLDNVREGVNEKIGQKFGVEEMRVLVPRKDVLVKLVAYGLTQPMHEAADAMYAAGALRIRTSESGGAARLETILPAYLKTNILNAMQKHVLVSDLEWHLVPTLDTHDVVGSGMIGQFAVPLRKADFLDLLRKTFGCGGIRYADAPVDRIQRVAWCGGAGSFLIQTALNAGADAFVTADITYHKFFENEGRMLLLDIGHYESEQFTGELILSCLSKTFPTFAVRLSELNTNPVKYC